MKHLSSLTVFFNVVILLITVLNLKLGFKFKIDPKGVLFKTWKKLRKLRRNFSKKLANSE